MAEIAHPSGDGTIEVAIVDRESHHGEYVQVEAVADGVELTDQSGELPWVEASEVEE